MARAHTIPCISDIHRHTPLSWRFLSFYVVFDPIPSIKNQGFVVVHPLWFLLKLYERDQKCYNHSMSLSTHVSGYFWDINTDTATPRKHPRYYVSRILEEGNRKAVNWLFRLFGKSKVKRLFPTLRLSERSRNYWRYYFKLE